MNLLKARYRLLATSLNGLRLLLINETKYCSSFPARLILFLISAQSRFHLNGFSSWLKKLIIFQDLSTSLNSEKRPAGFLVFSIGQWFEDCGPVVSMALNVMLWLQQLLTDLQWRMLIDVCEQIFINPFTAFNHSVFSVFSLFFSLWMRMRWSMH